MDRPRSDPILFTAFGLLVLIGGTNFVAVRFSNFELPPFWGASTRFAAASLLFLFVALARRTTPPRGTALVGTLLYGFLSFGASYAFAYYGLVHVQAGLASVILALVPLVTLLLALAHGLERFHWRGLMGGLLAVGGITVIYSEQLEAAIPVGALVALLAATVSIGESSIVAKRFPKADLFWMNAIGMAVGAAFLYGLSLASHEVHVLPSRGSTLLALGYLVTAGSLGLFFLYLFVLRRWSATSTSYSFVLAPVVTVGLGFLLAHETITPLFVSGGILVLAGVWVGALAAGAAPAAPAPKHPPAAPADEGTPGSPN